MPETCWDRS